MIPTQQNCPHSPDGWCLTCVQKLQSEKEMLEGALEHPDDPRHWCLFKAERDALLDVLRDLVERCDGEEGVRADGSNIQTIKAHHCIERILGADDDHHAMMNGPRIRQAFGLE